MRLRKKQDVIEKYWPDYLDHCMRSLDSKVVKTHKYPTVDGFWAWYITDGPMGVKHKNLFYNPIEKVRYR